MVAFPRDYQENAASVSQTALRKAWDQYVEAGYRPIPLHGFKASEYHLAKKPTIKAWQDVNPREIDTSKLAGIGLVVGAKSRHIGLDCDSAEMELEAANALQAMGIADTWIVQSGSGHKHFHFRILPDVILPPHTQRLKNEFDFFVANGQMVAPPTQWESYSWITIANSPRTARILSQAQLNQLMEFVKDYRIKKGKSEQPETLRQFRFVGKVDLRAIFDSYLASFSRNPALFYTAVYAFNNGYSAEKIATELLPYFVSCPPTEKTQERKQESDESRYKEGLRNIQNACSGQYHLRKPALNLPNVPANALREFLLNREEIPALRLLEALYRCDITGGQILTRKEIERAVATILSTKQCRTALESEIFVAITPKSDESGNFLFESAHFERGTNNITENTTHNVCRGVKKAKTPAKAGRPEKLYIIPTLSSLYDLFGVLDKGSDELPIEALKSNRSYRIALLKAFIERCPGRWSWRYLAGLLGVQRREVRRYAKEAGLTVIPQIERQKVNRYNAMELLPENAAEFERYGYWLEDWNGNKHMPDLAHAERLLVFSEISLCNQLPNYFTTSAVPPYFHSCQPKQRKNVENHG